MVDLQKLPQMDQMHQRRNISRPTCTADERENKDQEERPRSSCFSSFACFARFWDLRKLINGPIHWSCYWLWIIICFGNILVLWIQLRSVHSLVAVCPHASAPAASELSCQRSRRGRGCRQSQRIRREFSDGALICRGHAPMTYIFRRDIYICRLKSHNHQT